MHLRRSDSTIKGGKMATYDEVSNTLSELEKKVLNHYNVAKVGMRRALSANIWNTKALPCLLLVPAFEASWVILFNWEGYTDDCFWNAG